MLVLLLLRVLVVWLRNKRACSMSMSQSFNTLLSFLKKTSSSSSKSVVGSHDVVSSLLYMVVEADDIGC